MGNAERDRRLDEVLAAYLARIDAGESVDREELVARHPDLADELRSFFAHKDVIAGADATREGEYRRRLGDASQRPVDSLSPLSHADRTGR